MITKLKASEIAEKEAARLAALPDYAAREYTTAVLHRENDSAFVFFAACPELIAEDYAPGGFFVYVDKSDGHILKQSEIANLSRRVAQNVLQAA